MYKHYHNSPKPLAEELQAVTLRDLRGIFGRKTLLAAANDALPVSFMIDGQSFRLYVYAQPHILPGKRFCRSDTETLRLWMLCPLCKHLCRKLFILPVGSFRDLRCRNCAGVSYLSKNSGGRKWYRNYVKPIRLLLRERRQLMKKAGTPENDEKLKQLAELAWILHERAKCRTRKHSNGNSRRVKRVYRDVDLVSW